MAHKLLELSVRHSPAAIPRQQQQQQQEQRQQQQAEQQQDTGCLPPIQVVLWPGQLE